MRETENKCVSFEIYNEPLLGIKEIAKLLNVHQRTLRIYDKENILSPNRTKKNRRCYSFNDLEKAKFIIFLSRNLALNISGIKIISKLFEKIGINSNEYLVYIKEIAKLANIDENIQKSNILKNAKKGRKPKKIFQSSD